jgi:16S rRNA (cytidine1402-2'-O)-methyltransferase
MHPIKGSLYLIPSLLSPDTAKMMPPYIAEVVNNLHHFFVENERSVRRFLKVLDPAITIDDRHFCVMDAHHPPDTRQLDGWLKTGLSVGVISEAGYPCIADPGNVLAREAHRLGARVIPLVGPNAMLMALAASGFNGQRFCFSGYVPIKGPERVTILKALEKKALSTGETQIFMETPYRNNALLGDIIQYLHAQTMLCVAADITAPTEFISTRSIREWQGNLPDLHKRPAVFLLNRSKA